MNIQDQISRISSVRGARAAPLSASVSLWPIFLSLFRETGDLASCLCDFVVKSIRAIREICGFKVNPAQPYATPRNPTQPFLRKKKILIPMSIQDETKAHRDLGFLARRERGAYPKRSATSEQRSQKSKEPANGLSLKAIWNTKIKGVKVKSNLVKPKKFNIPETPV
jgi:hypothetical protein